MQRNHLKEITPTAERIISILKSWDTREKTQEEINEMNFMTEFMTSYDFITIMDTSIKDYHEYLLVALLRFLVDEDKKSRDFCVKMSLWYLLERGKFHTAGEMIKIMMMEPIRFKPSSYIDALSELYKHNRNEEHESLKKWARNKLDESMEETRLLKDENKRLKDIMYLHGIFPEK